MKPARPRLLVVDDEEALMQALCSTLDANGYDTTGCISAADAMDALRAEPYDLLLTDMMMPGTDGIALARAAIAHDPELVAVMMTGRGSIESAVEAMQLGVVDYVLKPFRLATLLPVLARATEVRALRRQNAVLQSQLQARTEALETANRELEAYAATVSHDLRAPLRGIDALAQLLARQVGEAPGFDARRLVELIGSRARRAQGLVEDLLRLSRIGRHPLARSRVDIRAMVDEVVADLVASGRHGPAVVCEVRPATPPAPADANLLRQVFANLIGNAVKFTADVPLPQVEVGGLAVGEVAVFFVRDNGPGFDMAESGKLFLPFERLRGAERFDGSGVGLSIVRRIVERHGGEVWADAAPGRGATFFFTLGGWADPVSDRAACMAALAAAGLAPRTPGAAPAGSAAPLERALQHAEHQQQRTDHDPGPP